jgi:hypothetical protein
MGKGKKGVLTSIGKLQANHVSHVIYETFMNYLKPLNRVKRLITTKTPKHGLKYVLGANKVRT